MAALFELQGKTERGLSAITQEQERIRNELKNLAKLSDQSKTSIELKHIEDSVTDVQNRESKLEDALLNNPAKALELPLLRKDLDGAKEKNQADLVAIRQDVDRVYDQNKWFLGLMGTMALGTLTLAVSNFFKKEKT